MTRLATHNDPATIAALVQEARLLLHADPAQARSHLAEAMDLLLPASTDQGGLAPWQVVRVQQRIAANPSSGVSCEDLAALTRLSVRHFSRAFKASFGMPPHAYVLQARIELAQRRMLQGERLAQVALDCGFTSQAHFCRVFRGAIGLTPTAWLDRTAASSPP